MQRTVFAVVVLTMAWVSVLAGAAQVQLFVDLPSRHSIGAVAYAHYVRATYLGPTRLLYPLAGGGGLFLAWTTLALSVAARAPRRVRAGLALTAAAALGGWLIDRFATLSAVRTVFVELASWCALGALVLAARAGAPSTEKERAG